jgi:hypothetical protein
MMKTLLISCVLVRALAAQCPALTPFAPPEKITATDRAYRFEGGYVAVIGEMRVDSDGSPVAYHPLNLGTTHLCNGLDPVIDGKRERSKKRDSPCFGDAGEVGPCRQSRVFHLRFRCAHHGRQVGRAVRWQTHPGAGSRRPRARIFHIDDCAPGAWSRRLT